MSENNKIDKEKENNEQKIRNARIVADNARYVLQQQSESIAAIDNKAVGLMTVITIAFVLFTASFTHTDNLCIKLVMVTIHVLLGASFLANLGLLIKTMLIRDFTFGYQSRELRDLLGEKGDDEVFIEQDMAAAFYKAELDNQPVLENKRFYLDISTWHTVINLVLVFLFYFIRIAVL